MSGLNSGRILARPIVASSCSVPQPGPSRYPLAFRRAHFSNESKRRKEAKSPPSKVPDGPEGKDATAVTKPRMLRPPHHGRYLHQDALNEAKRTLQLRRMPYDEEDFVWLRQARSLLPVLAARQQELQKKQNAIASQIEDYMKTKKVEKKKQKKMRKTMPVVTIGGKGAKKGTYIPEEGAESIGAEATPKGEESTKGAEVLEEAVPMGGEATKKADASVEEETSTKGDKSRPEAEALKDVEAPKEAANSSAGELASNEGVDVSKASNSAEETDVERIGEDAGHKNEQQHPVPNEEKLLQEAQRERTKQILKLREEAKDVKKEIESVNKQSEAAQQRANTLRLNWPNLCHPDAPVGSEENAVVVKVKDPINILPRAFDVMKESWNRSVMQIKDFPDGPGADLSRDHLKLAHSIQSGQIDQSSGILATGSSWPYLLGSISMLEHALSQYALSLTVQRGFLPVTPPDVVRTDLADRCGFRPRDEKAKQTYHLEADRPKNEREVNGKNKGETDNSEHNDHAQDLCLAATAEIPLAGLLASRVFEPTTAKSASSLLQRYKLPIKLVALGHAFRAEAGARGADTRGLYRVHQFTKVEMFVATEGDNKESDAMLEELRGIQEEVVSGLGLPYRVLDMPTEELGASAYRKYDIEVWMPGRGSWGEVSSASNCTNYQALRLNTRIKANGEMRSAHTLNATAAAIPRLIVAILENHGVQGDRLVLPDALKPFWLGGPDDVNVTWLPTSKPASRLQKAIQQVRSIARRNGTDATTMVASFMILHELTAIVPLIVLFYLFGAFGIGQAVSQWLLGNKDLVHDDEGLLSRFRAWARLKEAKFERYCRRKGYFGFEKQDSESIPDIQELGKNVHIAGSFANMVAAYIVVKALIPLRIGLSIALAGRFSRSVLEPVKRVARQAFRRPKPVNA